MGTPEKATTRRAASNLLKATQDSQASDLQAKDLQATDLDTPKNYKSKPHDPSMLADGKMCHCSGCKQKLNKTNKYSQILSLEEHLQNVFIFKMGYKYGLTNGLCSSQERPIGSNQCKVAVAKQASARMSCIASTTGEPGVNTSNNKPLPTRGTGDCCAWGGIGCPLMVHTINPGTHNTPSLHQSISETQPQPSPRTVVPTSPP